MSQAQSERSCRSWEDIFPPCQCCMSSRWYFQIFNLNKKGNHRWTFCSLPWTQMTGAIWWSPSLPVTGRPCRCCYLGICCLPVEITSNCKNIVFLFFARLDHHSRDPDHNHWTAAGGGLSQTGHWCSVVWRGEVWYFTGLAWNMLSIRDNNSNLTGIHWRVWCCPGAAATAAYLQCRVPARYWCIFIVHSIQLACKDFYVQVRDAIASSLLAPRGRRPVVCIDEAQVISQVVLNWHLLTDPRSAAWLGECQSWVWCQHMGMVNSSHETQVDLIKNNIGGFCEIFCVNTGFASPLGVWVKILWRE